MIGYAIVAVALVLFVQAKNVYPQLLLGRLFFSVGAAAASTMVTAVLPTMSFVAREPPAADPSMPSAVFEGNGHAPSPSVSSELTITPARFHTHSQQRSATGPNIQQNTQLLRSSSSQIAGFVGTCAGCGALLALLLFLPLPAHFQDFGTAPDRALQYSYYIVAGIALLVAVFCFVGLRNLQGENAKGWTSQRDPAQSRIKLLWGNLSAAFTLGLSNSDISLGYIGGFVARASSVAISLFVPLLVNATFLSSGLCPNNGETPGGLPDIKRKCPQAYILAAELTGVSQFVALLCAPVFGYASSRLGTTIPLMFAAAAGIVGYPVFATQFSPEDHKVVAFLAVCLIGISQIGAIVCSLATLSSGVLDYAAPHDEADVSNGGSRGRDQARNTEREVEETDSTERSGLLNGNKKEDAPDLAEIKGSIAGMYSLYGGAGILILTKLGGYLFDKVSFGAPFYIMAIFNAILMAACISITAYRELAPGLEHKVIDA